MTDSVELLLVDGPGAGQRVRIGSDWASYMHVSYPGANRLVLNFDAADEMPWAGPTHTNYRIGFARNLDRQIVRVGWCSGEAQPDPEQLQYWIRHEPPVKVAAGADAWSFDCDFALRFDQADTTIQGACRCGWETETVPRRRLREVLALVEVHTESSIAAAGRHVRSRPRAELTAREAALMEVLDLVEEANRLV